MKKLLLILVMALAVSGCSINSDKSQMVDESGVKNTTNDYNESDAISRINSINNGATPKVKPTGKKEEAPKQENMPTEQKLELEDLAVAYSGAIMKTNFGDITLKFYGADSPVTVNNFLNLAKKGFYNDTKFHRVIKDFMIQGGDPNSKDDDWSNDGIGGPGYKFQDEFNSHKLVRGSLAMANSGPNTNGSQFFIVTAKETPWLDGRHTNFGEVVGGMDIVDKIENVAKNENDHPTTDVIVKSVELVK